VICECTAEDRVVENPSRLGEEHRVLSAKAELDEYLALAKVRQNNLYGITFDVLEWWGVHSCRYPNVARMARGLLALPTSSVGGERSFTSAGKKLGDAQKSTSEGFLELSVMVFEKTA
jgi:hypothetical protein